MKSAIYAIEKAILEIYHKQDLTCLIGLDESYVLKGKEILPWYNEVILKNRKISETDFQFDYDKNIDELLYLSDSILYATANLYLYRDHINNPLKEKFHANGETFYPNYENMESKRFCMYYDIAIQSLYNYWDRIGDLLESFFPIADKRTKVHFQSALEAIPKTEFCSSLNYKWLYNFKKLEYEELNAIRKDVVHHQTYRTKYWNQHRKVSTDEQGMLDLQKERECVPDFFKKHISLTLEGFEKALLLLEEANKNN